MDMPFFLFSLALFDLFGFFLFTLFSNVDRRQGRPKSISMYRAKLVFSTNFDCSSLLLRLETLDSVPIEK